jgi:rhamnose transport system permease protein
LLLATHYPPVVVLAICLLLGLALGAFNGLLVAGLRLPSIVVTLATMVTWREALRWQRQGMFVNLPAAVQWFGLTQTQGQILIVSLALGLLALLAWAAKFLAAGRYVYAVGSNAEAARLAGVSPRLVTFILFAFQGGLCAAAAWLNTVQSPQVDPKSGSGLELKVIAAAVVGGVAITGGRGGLLGAALGLGLLICIGPALVYFRLEPYWERAIQGAIILLAVMVDALPARARRPVARANEEVRPA